MTDFGMCRQEFDSLTPDERIEAIEEEIELTKKLREEEQKELR